ncbi:MAG: helix-turn-helix transcriptional regulator [Eubacteriales bacterium]|nr:helix-turn-helix transcriptional regulator [Eubacteriales bacterium]
MYDELFCKRLTQLRMAKGVSARDMSLSIGQSAGYINSIENKNNLPSMSVFFYICEYLNIKPKDFFDFESSNPERLNELINNLKSLNDEQLLNILAVVKDIKK